jgi:hypothetical protein
MAQDRQHTLIGASAWSWKTPISFVVSVRVNQHWSHWTDLREIWYLGLLWKSVEEVPNLVKIGRECWDNLHGDVSTFYCCRSHKFGGEKKKHICAAFSAAFKVFTLLAQQHTERTVVSITIMVTRTRHNVGRTLPIFWSLPSVFPPNA